MDIPEYDFRWNNRFIEPLGRVTWNPRFNIVQIKIPEEFRVDHTVLHGMFSVRL